MAEMRGLRKDMRGRGQGKSLGKPLKYNVVHSFDKKHSKRKQGKGLFLNILRKIVRGKSAKMLVLSM